MTRLSCWDMNEPRLPTRRSGATNLTAAGIVRSIALFALFALFPFVESMVDESPWGAAAPALSRTELSVTLAAVCAVLSGLAFARRRAGVTASVQFAGIVAQRSGTMLARGAGVVSATGAFAAVSCALPAFSHEKAPSAVSAAAAVTEAARLFLRIMIDSGVERVLVGDRPRITTI